MAIVYMVIRHGYSMLHMVIHGYSMLRSYTWLYIVGYTWLRVVIHG